VQKPRAAAASDVVRTAAALEAALRSCNSLLERLHHSYFMYLQPSTSTFITIEAYIVAPLLLIVALLLHAASVLVAVDAPAAASTLHEPAQRRASLRERLLAQLRGRKASETEALYPPGPVHPLRLRVSLQQFGRCACGALLLHVLCGTAAAVAVIASDAQAARQDAMTTAAAVLGLVGLCAALSAPLATAHATADPDTDRDSRSSSKSSLPDWQAFKAVALLATAVLMAGALFVNWCASCCTPSTLRHITGTPQPQRIGCGRHLYISASALFTSKITKAQGVSNRNNACRALVHLSLVCLTVQLIATQPIAQMRWRVLLPLLAVAWVASEPRLIADAMSVSATQRSNVPSWLSNALKYRLHGSEDSTVATRVFMGLVFTPAWCLPALIGAWRVKQ
jgi:Gaa1-like, GPI transamidase component